jgi:hypothetical protein
VKVTWSGESVPRGARPELIENPEFFAGGSC